MVGLFCFVSVCFVFHCIGFYFSVLRNYKVSRRKVMGQHLVNSMVGKKDKEKVRKVLKCLHIIFKGLNFFFLKVISSLTR